MDYIILDPGLRVSISQFAPNIRDEVRRAYIEKGPTQSFGHKFPKADDKRSFQKNWFKQYNWLEYSLVEDRAYCFTTIFLEMSVLLRNLVMTPSQKRVSNNGKIIYCYLEDMLADQVVCIIKQDRLLWILTTKEQV